MHETLGWVNLLLITFMGVILPLRARYRKTKSRGLLLHYQRVRALHPFVGGVIVTLGLVHGYMSLGTIRLHTGTLIVLVVAFMGVVAFLGPRLRFLKKRWRVVHRYTGLALWGFILLHLLNRSLI